MCARSRDLLGTYGARHLVTATLDSGQIGGGIFFFLEYPSGALQAIFFDLKDVFTQFLHNFEVHISGELLYVTLSLDHMEGDFYCFNIIPRQRWLK